ncbi:MAG: hypothetical protein WDO71_00520 [Bacteroidota bacterium]
MNRFILLCASFIVLGLNNSELYAQSISAEQNKKPGPGVLSF